MDKAKLKELIEMFEDSGIAELEFSRSFWRGTRIRLRRYAETAPAPAPAAPAAAPATPAPAPAAEDTTPVAPAEEGHLVRSPMVGTMYHAPSPDAEVFVRPGDQVQKGQTLCIIEAMKIMNEIESDVSGKVVKVLVDDGAPVEYNQSLIQIDPA